MSLPSNLDILFPYLEYLDVSHNALHGSIPSLDKALYLQVLDLSFNKLDGDISAALTGNGSMLTSLLLSNNYLQGSMLPWDTNMGELRHLSLENNCISGGVAPSLSNSSLLTTLNVRNNQLSGMIPSGLFNFSHSLGAILLSGNRLEGLIPVDFCLIDELHLLDLSNNEFSGAIPGCFFNVFWTDFPLNYNDGMYSSNLTGQHQEAVDFTTKEEYLTYEGVPLTLMTGIDFSMNQLSRPIPDAIGYLAQLRSLNLSFNKLTGPIPDTFVYLRAMEILDLSYNLLVGRIPPQLSNLSSLSTFVVVYNNLTGEIPFLSQLDTFSPASFEGNEGLCGKVIDKKCQPSIAPADQDHGSQTCWLDVPMVYYSFVAGSYAFGLLGILAFLAWNAPVRMAWFSMVDGCMVWLGWDVEPLGLD